MKNLLLVAFAFLLRAICASEPAAPGGFYLNQQPVSVAQAYNIMFNPAGFRELRNLSIVAPLSEEDFTLLCQGVAVQMHRVVNLEHGIWNDWMEALQLPVDDPSLQQYEKLHQYLWSAARFHVIHPETMELYVRQAVSNNMGGGRVLLRINMDPIGLLRDRFISRLMLVIALCWFFWNHPVTNV